MSVLGLCAVLLCAAGADAPEPAEVAAPALRSSTAARAEALLEAKPALLSHHRGYWAYLQSHPDVAGAEEALAELQVLSTYRAATEGFDEALLRNPAQERRFDEYGRFLGEHKEIRQPIEALERMELGRGGRSGVYAQALAYLRAHPEKALEFLERPEAAKPTPEALRPLLSEFRKEGGLRATLLQNFQQIHDAPGAHLWAYPWWQGLAEEGGDVAGNFSQMMAYFKSHPAKYWVWRRGNVALAEAPKARDWIRYWHRRVRREADLNAVYWGYLQELRQDPDRARAAEAQWRKSAGPLPQWPPLTRPPKLAPMPRHKDRAGTGVRRPEVPAPVKPVVPHPSIQRPSRPQMPEMPVRPVANSGTTSRK